MVFLPLLLAFAGAVPEVNAARPHAGPPFPSPYGPDESWRWREPYRPIEPELLAPRMDQKIKSLTPECQKQMRGLVKDITNTCWNMRGGRSGSPQQWQSQLEYCKGTVFSVFEIRQHHQYDWWIRMTTSEKESVLWAGFWDGEGTEAERTSKQALFDFAKSMGKETVHPSTELGRLVDKHKDLEMCSKDSNNNAMVSSFWKHASVGFVNSMSRKKQSSIVVFANKDLNPAAERSLQKSVLWNFELPTIGWQIMSTEWHPQMIVVDLRGTCEALQLLIERQLCFSPLYSTQHKEPYPVQAEAVKSWLKEKPMICLDCVEPCKLNKDFAEVLKKNI